MKSNRPTIIVTASLVAISLLWSTGCATLEKAFSEEGVIYKPTARGNYEAGEEAIESRDWDEAVKYLRHVKSKFPYSKYSILSALRIADAHYGAEKYLEAIDAYRTFIQLHPKHQKVPFATFMIARCYYERMPEEWFFLPPVREKDQTHTIDAQNALQDFLARYPRAEQVKEAEDLLQQVRSRLIEHERYTANFYGSSGHWRAAAWRSLTIAERYPKSPEAAEALLTAGDAYERLGEGKAALRAYNRVIKDFPKSEAAEEAKERIDDGVENPDVDEQPLTPEEE